VVAFADSHCHLADPAFADDVDAAIGRASAVGARALICIGESPAAALRAQTIASRHPGRVAFTCGVHPHDAAGWRGDRDCAAIRAAVAAGAVAVGECGLDYHYDHSPRERQREVVETQLALAAELDRPIVLHTREAEADTRDLLTTAARAGVSGVLHCFTGSGTLARAGLDAGWYVSFSGIVTFRRWDDLELLRLVPDERLLVESDAPYLAPVPHRGRRNEPAWVPATLARLADVRGTTVEHVAAVTLANTRRLFRLSGAPDDPSPPTVP
jgi:TatD DNase family protein